MDPKVEKVITADRSYPVSLSQLIMRAGRLETVEETLQRLEEANGTGAGNVVLFSAQKLLEYQKEQARKNIGAQPAEEGKGLSTNDFTQDYIFKINQSQPSRDINLLTIDKSIVGAINELYNALSVIGSWGRLNFKGEYKEGEVYRYNDAVSFLGCIFSCAVARTTVYPHYNSNDWLFVVGNPNYEMKIVSSEGPVLLENDATTLTADVYKYNQRATDDIPAEQWSWERESSLPEYDAVWNAQHIGIGNELRITTSDLPGKGLRTVKFIVTAHISLNETVKAIVEI